jgi:hypothetical protein
MHSWASLAAAAARAFDLDKLAAQMRPAERKSDAVHPVVARGIGHVL